MWWEVSLFSSRSSEAMFLELLLSGIIGVGSSDVGSFVISKFSGFRVNFEG